MLLDYHQGMYYLGLVSRTLLSLQLIMTSQAPLTGLGLRCSEAVSEGGSDCITLCGIVRSVALDSLAVQHRTVIHMSLDVID